MSLRLLWPDLLDAPELDDVEVIPYDAGAPLPESVSDADVFVVWGRSADLLREDARLLRNVQFVQTFMAGADAVVAAGFPEDVPVCSGIGLHDRPVAEHALGMILALVRQFPDCVDAQRSHEWLSRISGPQPLHPDGPVTTLLDARVLIWGFGSIAATLAPMLTALGADVRGVARSAGERHGYEVITEDALEPALAECDVLISILPGTPEARHVLNGTRFAQLPEHAYVVNVGRGSVLAEDDLVEALRTGQIAGAALDVMETEPLPAESPLWDAPGIFLTPHCAGGRPVGYADRIRENLDALRGGGAFTYEV